MIKRAGATASASPSVLPARTRPRTPIAARATASTAHPRGILPFGLLYDAVFAFGCVHDLADAARRPAPVRDGGRVADVDVLGIAKDFFRRDRLR